MGNNVITPINKDLFIELWETIKQSQIEKEIWMKIKFFTEILVYKI